MSVREHFKEHFWSYATIGGLLGWAAIKGEEQTDDYFADAYEMTLKIWVCGRCHEVYDVDEKDQADMCCLEEGGRAELFNADSWAKRFPNSIILYNTKGIPAKFRKDELDQRDWDGWVQLQSYGRTPAVKAEKLTLGDVIIYNYGYKGKILSIKPKGKASLVVETKTPDGKIYDRTYRKTSLIPVKQSWQRFKAEVNPCAECYGTGGLYDSYMGIDDVCAVCHGTGQTDEIESEDFASVILAPEPTSGPMQQALMTNYLMRKAMMEEELLYLQQEVRGGRMTKKQMAYRLMELDNRLRAEEEPPKKQENITYMRGVKVKPRKLNGDLPPETAMKRTQKGRKDPEHIDVNWDSNTKPYHHDPFNEVDWGAEEIKRGRKHKVGRQIVEECVDLRGSKADATSNYYRVRFRDPKDFTNFRVPEWASRAANTIGLRYYDVIGSKITMGQDTEGSWSIQSVMIPRHSYVSPEDALKIANHIQDRLEREGKWAKKECKDNERVLVVV
jgi:hypothetical protein